MKNLCRILFSSCIFSCLSLNCFGQEISRDVVSTQGANYQSSLGFLEWTLGEVIVSSPDHCAFTFGFHQTFLARQCGFNDPEAVPTNEDLIIYPNPTTQLLNIELEKGLIQDVILFDNVGAVVLSYDIGLVPSTILDLGPLAAGSYVMQITTDFKILNQKILKID